LGWFFSLKKTEKKKQEQDGKYVLVTAIKPGTTGLEIDNGRTKPANAALF